MNPVLCLVTDRSVVPLGELPALAGRAARAGVDLIQVRERGLADGELLALVRDLVLATEGSSTRVVVNERADVAIAAGAAGVHLRADSVTASRVRSIVPSGFLISRSVHSLAEALHAERDGSCDYLVFGTVFASAGKPPWHPTAGLDGLRRVCEAVRLPVIAIGGVTAEAANGIAHAGAAGIAAIRLFGAAVDLQQTVDAVRRAFDS